MYLMRTEINQPMDPSPCNNCRHCLSRYSYSYRSGDGRRGVLIHPNWKNLGFTNCRALKFYSTLSSVTTTSIPPWSVLDSPTVVLRPYRPPTRVRLMD